MKYGLLAGVGAVALGFVSPAMAATGGNIVLTGHDDDYHCAGGAGGAGSIGISPCAQIAAMTAFVRNGSSLPVLVIDNGSELSSALTYLGIPYTKVGVASVSASMFNHSTYSAFAVASVSTCGGCDNPTTTGATLAGFSTAIDSFFNSGGGILGLTAATGGTFDYVPQAASGVPIAHNSGFVATSTGISGIGNGFNSVNGDETHNIFTSYTGYQVAEVDSTDSNAAVTIFDKNATITSGHIHSNVPEPMTLSLLGVGLFGLAAARRRRR